MSSTGCHIVAVGMLPLADAVSLHGLYPVVTAVLAPCALGETVSLHAVLAAITAVAGCTLVAKGRHGPRPQGQQTSSSDSSTLGFFIALVGAFLASITYMLIRRLMRQSNGNKAFVQPDVVVWMYSATALVVLSVSLPFSASLFTLRSPLEAWVALLGVGLSSVLEQLLVTFGFKGVPAGVGTMLLTMETVIAFIFSLTIFHERVRPITAFGVALIAVAVLTTSAKELRVGAAPGAPADSLGTSQDGGIEAESAKRRPLEKIGLRDAVAEGI